MRHARMSEPRLATTGAICATNLAAPTPGNVVMVSGATDARQAGVGSRQLTDGGPIQALAALREQAQETVVQQTADRHGNTQRFGHGEQQADILVSERGGETGRLEPARGNQSAVGP